LPKYIFPGFVFVTDEPSSKVKLATLTPNPTILIRITCLCVKGLPIGALDVLIAGTAVANQAILVSHNLAEFNRVEGLIIEDWY